MDYTCIQLCKGGIPHGYRLDNGTIVVWSTPHNCNNLVSEIFARAMFTNLVIIN